MQKAWGIFYPDGRVHVRFHTFDAASEFLNFLSRTNPEVSFLVRRISELENSLLDLGYNLDDLEKDNPFNAWCDFSDGRTKRDAERGFAAPVSAGSPPLLTGGETKGEEGGKHE